MALSDLFNPEKKITGPYDGLSSGADQVNFPDVYTLHHAMRDAMVLDMGPDTLILGVDGTGQPITVDLTADNPHIMISAGTGGGKSATLRALAAQCLVKGYQVIILDIKRHSHMWAENLPNVYIARSVREVGNALHDVGEGVHLRNQEAEQWLRARREAGDWDSTIADAPIGRRTVVIYEEMNSTHEELATMTREMFKNSTEFTGIQGFKDGLNLGRAAKVHFMCVGQYMNGSAMGKNAQEGTALRENFGTRLLISFSDRAWKMLAWDCGMPKAAPTQPGRGYLCRGGKARMVQLLYVTEREAHEWVKASMPRELTAAPHSVSDQYPNLPAHTPR